VQQQQLLLLVLPHPHPDQAAVPAWLLQASQQQHHPQLQQQGHMQRPALLPMHSAQQEGCLQGMHLPKSQQQQQQQQGALQLLVAPKDQLQVHN
jgi:hypothetical protein